MCACVRVCQREEWAKGFAECPEGTERWRALQALPVSAGMPCGSGEVTVSLKDVVLSAHLTGPADRPGGQCQVILLLQGLEELKSRHLGPRRP